MSCLKGKFHGGAEILNLAQHDRPLPVSLKVIWARQKYGTSNSRRGPVDCTCQVRPVPWLILCAQDPRGCHLTTQQQQHLRPPPRPAWTRNCPHLQPEATQSWAEINQGQTKASPHGHISSELSQNKNGQRHQEHCCLVPRSILDPSWPHLGFNENSLGKQTY